MTAVSDYTVYRTWCSKRTRVKENVMRWEKFTIKAQEAIAEAQKKAEELAHQMIEAEHLLYALVSDKEGVVVSALEKLGASPSAIKAELEKEFTKMPKVAGATQVYIGPMLNKAIEIAFSEAERLKDEYVSLEHLLIGIADLNQGAAARILKGQGVTKDRIYTVLKDIRGTQRITDQAAEVYS
jgi:ATP-dependent Clp protease ATP-binding subunit ClpB